MSTRRSILLAGHQIVLKDCGHKEIDGLVMATKSEAIHIIFPRTIVLPDFYRAMLYTLESSGADFVFCHEGILDDKPRIIKPDEKDFDPAQVIVKTWVYREIGIGAAEPADLIFRVMGEYRGIEVPHVLTMRL